MSEPVQIQYPEVHDRQALGNEITRLSAYIYAATYRLLTLIREFDEKEYWHGLGLCSCAHWLNFKCGIGMNAAREKMRVAHALKGLPAISAAFQRGEVSYSKVRAMTRIANEKNEDYLMSIARHGTAFHVEKLVSLYRRCERLQEVQHANKVHAARSISVRYDADGSMIIQGRLPAEAGALVVKALEMAMEHSDADAPDAALQTAPCELPGERVSFSARRVDALVEVAESYLENSPVSTSTADRHQVVIHVSAETLAGKDDISAEMSADQTDGISHIEDGPRVSAETSRRIGCDCSIVALVRAKNNEALSIGRKTRSIPPSIRRALRFRDQGCRFPGCTNKYFIDGHHIKHWANGGETSLDNLVQLCRHHHRLVHEGGYDCRRETDGTITFSNIYNERLQTCAEPVALEDDTSMEHWMVAQATEFDIDEDTCVPKWYAGDTMDWDLAVSHLYY